MQMMNNPTSYPEPGSGAVMAPPAVQVWAPAHHFFRVHDPASFAWLDSLSPLSTTATPPSAKCFGMDVVYLALDLLYWFPSETVLAIPFLEVPPPEYFLVCNSGGQRWWCFVLLRQRADKACALVFDVAPSVLLIAGLGLRETDIDPAGAVTRGRDFNLAPNAAVLCPKDNRAIRFERLSPQTQEYFCVYEGGEPGGGVNAYPLADVLGSRNLPQTAPMEVSLGTRTLGLRLRVNADEALMRLVDSLGPNGMGGVL